MDIVIYFSPTGGTKKIAEYIASYLNINSVDLTNYISRKQFDYSIMYEYLILLFPVYSQNIPNPVLEIIKKLKSKNILLLTTYGRMGMGNVLYEAQKIIKSNVIGGAYIPTKHTYNNNSYFDKYECLNILLNRVKDKVIIPKIFPRLSKNIFANFVPNFRSRLGVKIIKTDKCIECSICNKKCPISSINNGDIDKNCIRCLSCFYNCPYEGLVVKYSKFLKLYLRKDKIVNLVIY